MEIRALTSQNHEQVISNILQSKTDTITYGISTGTLILKGLNQIDEEYCRENDLEIYYSDNEGGVIIISAGDVEFDIFRQDGWTDGENYLRLICNELKKRIPNIEVKGNDLLVDDTYKVASYSSRNMGGGFIFTGMHISVNVNMELIQRLCTKEMVKIPKGLSEYDITSQDIINIIESIL